MSTVARMLGLTLDRVVVVGLGVERRIGGGNEEYTLMYLPHQNPTRPSCA